MKVYRQFIARLAPHAGMAVLIFAIFSIVLYGLFYLLFEYFDRPWLAALAFTGLAVLFAMAALGWFLKHDLVAALKDADKKVKTERIPAANFHETLLGVISLKLSHFALTYFLVAECFLFSCYAWAAVYPDTFTRNVSFVDINYFVLDLTLKGAVFDFMEHFDKSVSHLTVSPEARGFFMYAFYFRLFVSLVVVGSVVRAVSLFKLAFAFPENKTLLAKLARNLSPKP